MLVSSFYVSYLASRSGSMSCMDRCPLPNAAMMNLIMWSTNNRLSAIYSALYSFWSACHAAVTTGQQAVGAQCDAYSIILFNERASAILANDFMSSPDQLLGSMLGHGTSGGMNFAEALRAGQTLMTQHWSTERFVTYSKLSMHLGPLALTLNQDSSHDIP